MIFAIATLSILVIAVYGIDAYLTHRAMRQDLKFRPQLPGSRKSKTVADSIADVVSEIGDAIIGSDPD